MFVRSATAAAAALLLAAPLTAQEQEGGTPEGWVVRQDAGNHGGGGTVDFRAMAPGWHITSGPSAIYYRPDQAAEGTFRVETEVHLFDPGRRNEGYGLVFGGSALDGEARSYTYFLIRRDGSFLIKRRDGEATETVEGWTAHDAVATWEEKGPEEATVTNVLAVEAAAGQLTFLVNGEAVHRMPRAGQHVDGLVGLRVNHGLNLHVTKLEVDG